VTIGEAAIAYTATTLALQESMPLERLNLTIVDQPRERLVVMLFARLWNQWLRTPASQSVFN
jgi:hypothetical protein